MYAMFRMYTGACWLVRLGLSVELVRSTLGEEDAGVGAARDENGEKDGDGCESEEAIGGLVDRAFARVSFERICHGVFVARMADEVLVGDGWVLGSSVGRLVHEPCSQTRFWREEQSEQGQSVEDDTEDIAGLICEELLLDIENRRCEAIVGIDGPLLDALE